LKKYAIFESNIFSVQGLIARGRRIMEDPAPDLPLSTETCYWLVCFLPSVFVSMCALCVLDPPPQPQDQVREQKLEQLGQS